MVQVEDARPQLDKEYFPWWWRDESAPIHQQLVETYEMAFALDYELGRRYLIRREGAQVSELPPMPSMLNKFPSLRRALFAHYSENPHANSSVREFTYPAHCNVWKDTHLIASVDAMREVGASSSAILQAVCAHLDKIEEKANSQTYRQIPRTAWDLSAPWDWVVERLHGIFEAEQRRHDIESRKQPRAMRKRWCTPLETWDLWAAGIYADEKFPSDSDNHRRSAERVEASGKNHSVFARWLIQCCKNFAAPSATSNKSGKQPHTQ